MSDHEFVFALELSDAARSAPMVGDLCTAVLGHVGYAAPAIAELTTEVAGAVAGRGGGVHRCDVRFVAHGGQLQIVVASAGAAEWRTTRPLPGS